MRIPKARILKYAAMGIIAAFIATFFLKKEKQQGHPRDYAEIAAEKIIRAATEYNSISFYVDGDTLSGFHYELDVYKRQSLAKISLCCPLETTTLRQPRVLTL